MGWRSAMGVPLAFVPVVVVLVAVPVTGRVFVSGTLANIVAAGPGIPTMTPPLPVATPSRRIPCEERSVLLAGAWRRIVRPVNDYHRRLRHRSGEYHEHQPQQAIPQTRHAAHFPPALETEVYQG